MDYLIKYDAACIALRDAVSIDEAKDIRDKSAVLQAYARQANNPELEAMAAKLRQCARRKIGEISENLEKVQGEHLPIVPATGRLGKIETLKAAGLSTSEAHRCEQLARIPIAEFEAGLKAKQAMDATTYSHASLEYYTPGKLHRGCACRAQSPRP
jgi:hypothetical protein